MTYMNTIVSQGVRLNRQLSKDVRDEAKLLTPLKKTKVEPEAEPVVEKKPVDSGLLRDMMNSIIYRSRVEEGRLKDERQNELKIIKDLIPYTKKAEKLTIIK